MPQPENEKFHISSISSRKVDGENQPKSNISSHHALSDEEYLSYKNDKSIIDKYFESIKLIQSVGMNLDDLVKITNKHLNDYSKTRIMGEKIINHVSLDVGRHFLNLLSLFRSFVDHTETKLKKDFGKNSSEVSIWKNALGVEYDSNFAYRFLYKLRNYAQHIGIPPIGLTFSEGVDQPSPMLELYFQKKELLIDKGVWGLSIYNEILELPENVPFLPIIDNWVNSFNRVSTILHNILLPSSLYSANRILSIRTQFNIPHNERVCIIKTFIKNTDPKQMTLHIDWVPESKARLIFESSINR